MTLDTRANRAVRSLQESTTTVSPLRLETVVTRHRRRSVAAGLVGALAIAIGSVAMAAILAEVPQDETQIAVTTIPQIPDTSLIGVPAGNPDPPAPGVQQKGAESTSPTPYTMFAGTADPGTVVVATSAYGSADLVVGASGSFQLKVSFEAPPTGQTFPVQLLVGDTSHDFSFTWLWNPAGVAVSAHQMYGSGGGTTPYEKYFGTAPPGTAVTATSAYGTAATESGDKGDWHLKVWFDGAPANTPFPVSVTVGDQVFAFEFVWNSAEPSFDLTVAQEGTASSSASPYTRFHGTAAPGTVIQASSQYGSGQVTVGDSGSFSLKVFFSGAPKGVKFPITLKVDGAAYGTYSFTSNHQAGPVSFTLSQYNTESWDASPWVKFHGTAQPGTQIVATSAYGSSSLTVDGSGEYYLKLWFSSLPPAGVKFPVTVKVNGATYGTYHFTSWFSGTTSVTPIVTQGWDANPYAKVEFWAAAGTKIDLVSDYGSASVTAGSTGSGHLKLHFSSLPPKGVPITVTVKVNGSVFSTFSFTSWYDPGTVAKTANLTNGTSDANPPWDKYYGTAPAGTTVTISSAYNAPVQVTADGNGNWHRKVEFTGAPLHQAFTVTVDVGGQLFHFGMIVTGS